VLDELLLVRAKGLGHAVELGGEPAELIGSALGDAGVQVSLGQAGGALGEPRHGPSHRVADVEAHARGEQGGAAEEHHGPQEAHMLHGAHVLLE